MIRLLSATANRDLVAAISQAMTEPIGRSLVDVTSRLQCAGLNHISGKNRLGRLTVRRTTIRKRMRAKLRELKQQLRMHMHDPVPQTGGWLQLVVQGYFNYDAVPGNLESLAVFRDRLLGRW